MQGACVIGIYGTNDFTGMHSDVSYKKLKLVCDELLITEIMFILFTWHISTYDKYTSIIVYIS